MHSPCLRSPGRVEHFLFLLHERFVSSASFIGLCSYLFVLVQTHGHLFYILQRSITLLLKLFQFQIGSSFSQILCPFDILPLWCFVVVFLDCFLFRHSSLLFATARCSTLILILPTAVLESSSMSQGASFLLLESGVRKQDLGPRCAHLLFLPFPCPQPLFLLSF